MWIVVVGECIEVLGYVIGVLDVVVVVGWVV